MALNLPFVQASRATLQAASKKIFYHIMGAQNLKRAHNKISSIDAWQAYLDTSGQYANIGGYVDDRPLPRVPDVTPDLNTYLDDDIAWEYEKLEWAGADGFWLNFNGWPDDASTGFNTNWDYTKRIQNGAVLYGRGLKCVPAPDLGGGVKTRPQVVNALAALFNIGGYYVTPSGKKLFGAYMTSGSGVSTYTPAFWAGVVSDLAALGHNCVFMPTTQETPWTTMLSTRGAGLYGVGPWGPRNPQGADSTIVTADSPRDKITTTHATTGVEGVGLKYLQPIAFQDERPRSGKYQEAGNSELLRHQWQTAILGGADFVQGITWNDYSEDSALAPSVNHGYSFLALMAYYSQWWKLGTAPTITADAIYLSHRVHPIAAVPTNPAQTTIQVLDNGTPGRDTVEALCFLTAAANVELTVGATKTVAASAGVASVQMPLAPGKASARILRNAIPVSTVGAKVAATTTAAFQDLDYRMVNSLDDGTTVIGNPPAPASTVNQWVRRAGISPWTRRPLAP